jgi:hypothetical protein
MGLNLPFCLCNKSEAEFVAAGSCRESREKAASVPEGIESTRSASELAKTFRTPREMVLLFGCSLKKMALGFG